MNIKLSEDDYKSMIIQLIGYNIDNLERLKQTKDQSPEWIYFIERLKLKSILPDIKAIPTNKGKPSFVAHRLMVEFRDDSKKDIVTMV